MSGLATSIGLISGIDIGSLVTQLISLQRLPAARMEQRIEGLQLTQNGFDVLSANLLSLNTSVARLNSAGTYSTLKSNVTDKAQFTVSTNSTATPGTYQFQAIQTAAAHEVISRGFANTDQQTIGTGTLTISTGGGLVQPTQLTALNGGDGVRRGTIRITDRSGGSADIDLSNAFTVTDVLSAINSQSSASVTAHANGDHLVLTDTSGGSAVDLSVTDLNGGHAAADLGIAGATAGSTLTGATVYTITGDFTLDHINDGNRLTLLEADGNEDEDIQITLSDGSTLDIDLDGAATLNDVIARINNHADNGGKITAELTDGRLQLTDHSGGEGNLSIADANNAAVVSALGLGTDVVDNQIVGERLLAGMNSVLLRNLRGGQGIDQLGELTLTNRAGIAATVDLTGVHSLDEVLNAISSATDGLGESLQLTARVNATGTGIEIVDGSGGAGNFQIIDGAGGTLASQLNIAVDDAIDSVDSGALAMRYVNAATSVSDYAPDGGGIAAGSFKITNSDGAVVTITIGSTAETVGAVMQRINAATAAVEGFNVTAELNDTGDGFVLIDTAGGEGELSVSEVGSTTAADLRLLGIASTPGDGSQRITSRLATIIDVTAEDTLDTLVEKLNSGAPALATVVDDGSAFNTKRLVLTSNRTGAAHQLLIDDGGLNLKLTTRAMPRDALLRVGSDVETGFLVASDSNRFENVVTGMNLTVLAPGASVAQVSVEVNSQRITDALQGFVDAYNTFVGSMAELTKFDPETGQRGVLQGEGVVLRIQQRLESLVNRPSLSPNDRFRSLGDLGVRFEEGGKLSLNTDRLADAIAEDAKSVEAFFRVTDSDDPADFGFAALAQQVLDSFTDPFTGSLTTERDALQSSVDSLTERVALLDEVLLVRRDRLIRQFINMENALGQLQSQQQAISQIAPLRVIRRNSDK